MATWMFWLHWHDKTSVLHSKLHSLPPHWKTAANWNFIFYTARTSILTIYEILHVGAKPALRHHHYFSIGEANLLPTSKFCYVDISYTERKKWFCWECKKYTKLCCCLWSCSFDLIRLSAWLLYLYLFLHLNSLFRCRVQLMLECPTTVLSMAELNSCKTVSLG